MEFKHTPVLLEEAVEGLQIKPGGKYIDATFGGGGHGKAIIDAGGIVLGIDQDPDAIAFIQKNFHFEILNLKLKIVQGNFRDIKQIAEENEFEKVDGVLFDLGVSSYQIDDSGRGFSFRRDEPLDMRMSSNSDLTASEIVNTWTQDALDDLISRFGEEQNSRKIAQAIVEARDKKEIETTRALADIILKAGRGQGLIHPATKTFQALRIEVNHELDAIRVGLREAFDVLLPGGRLIVISFHSLEDRIVKNTFREWEQTGRGEIIHKKPIIATDEEVARNSRARSAKLRIIQKITA